MDDSFDASTLFSTPTRGFSKPLSGSLPQNSPLLTQDLKPTSNKGVRFSGENDPVQRLFGTPKSGGGSDGGVLGGWGARGRDLSGSFVGGSLGKSVSGSNMPMTPTTTPSVYPSLPVSQPRPIATPMKSSAPVSQAPSTPQLTKQSVLVPISLKAGAKGVARVGMGRMAQRLRVNLVVLVGLWWAERTRGYKYLTAALVLSLPSLDTPLYLLEHLINLVLLYNIAEALYKLNTSAPQTTMEIPLTPQQRILQRGGGGSSKIAGGLSFSKGSPLTRPSLPATPTPASPFTPSAAPYSPSSPLSLSSPLPKSRSANSLSSAAGVSSTPAPLSSPRKSQLSSSVGPGAAGSPLKYSMGLGRSGMGNGLGASVGSRRVSDGRAVERLLDEAF